MYCKSVVCNALQTDNIGIIRGIEHTFRVKNGGKRGRKDKNDYLWHTDKKTWGLIQLIQLKKHVFFVKKCNHVVNVNISMSLKSKFYKCIALNIKKDILT